MALKLMYITNSPEVAKIAQKAGVDRIFVDLEYIGKAERQGGMDTVQSKHTLDDIKRVAEVLHSSELLVRVNPIHDQTSEYCSSEEEINTAILNGADILMLPYFKTLTEVKRFLKAVNGRVKTMLLVETPEAVEIVEDITYLAGVDYIHIGLNDLSLGYKQKFMFEPLADGTVERVCKILKERNMTYGFGGIASLGKGLVPAEMVITEHYRLGSQCAILSRSFCNVDKIENLKAIKIIFDEGMEKIRKFEKHLVKTPEIFEQNRLKLCEAVKTVVSEKVTL